MNSNISTELVIKLNEASLARLGDRVQVFTYDRHQIVNGIVHIGVGGFYRAHQALYLDNYFQQTSERQWGICGVGLLEFARRMRDALHSQDSLYTLIERSIEGGRA